MDRIDMLKNTITEEGRKAAKKAKAAAELLKLKSRVATCEEVMRRNYAEIGRLYYEQHGDEPEERFAKQCSAIRNAQNGADELKKKIEELRQEI